MKRITIIFLYLFLSAFAAKAQEKKTSPLATTPGVDKGDAVAGIFKFRDIDNTHDLGEVPEGPVVECDFEFSNVGKKPIIITAAQASCDCTVATWPHDPVLPGMKGVIHVRYTTEGREGPIFKDIAVNSNATNGRPILHIRGTVLAKKNE